MKLSAYLAADGRTATELAALAGCAVSTITRAAKGEITPSRELMVKLIDATGGAVTPNDFFEVAPSHEARAA